MTRGRMIADHISNDKSHSLEANEDVPALFEDVSFLCMTRDNLVRKHLISFVKWRWFERFVILVILSNCVMLAMYDPLDKHCESSKCRTLEALEMVVFSFFAAEMLAKMIAMGVYGSRSYFSDRWNILDFFIVVAGVVDMLGPGGDFLTIVRLSRVLRPLRAINRVPSIRILVTLLMDTIPMLGNVLLLAFLVFSIFGIVGVQVWQGKLRNRCFLNSNFSAQSLNISNFYAPESMDYICSLPSDGGMQTCSGILTACENEHQNGSTTCQDLNQYYTSCEQRGPNPYYDNMSFDNIAMAWIFIYQVVTVEGWSELMYLIQDASHFYTWIYFVVLITIGSFFLVNLSLVVITMQFSETKRREMQIIREQRGRQVTDSQMSLISDFKIMWHRIRDRFTCKRKGSVHHFHHHEYFHIHHHTVRCETCNMRCGGAQDPSSPKEILNEPGTTIPKVEISCFDDDIGSHLKTQRRFSLSCPSLTSTETTPERKLSGISLKTPKHSADQEIRLNESVDKKLEHLRLQRFLAPQNKNCGDYEPLRRTSDVSNSLSIHAESVSSVCIEKKQSPAHASLTTKTSLSLLVNGNSTQVKTEAYCKANTSIVKEPVKAELSTEAKANNSVKLQTPKKSVCKTLSNASKFSGVSENKSDEISELADTSSEALYGSMFDLRNADKYYVSVEPTFFQKFRRNCKKLSESRKFSHFIMVIIVINTICMGLEHHNQPQKMTFVLEQLNLIFIWIFGFEMCIKLLGVGPKIYFRNGFNCFDSLIVVLSVAELLTNNNGNRSSNVIVLRSLRLLRIFKLVRPMRHQMLVMLRTMSSVMTFFALLFLFMFTFAILGMHLFGGKFNFDGVISRSNFDSFIQAMVTVFQILTQEDWNLVMYDGMRATGHKWASLYFLALMTIGYYVLLNLLVAILVEGFTTPMEKRRMAKRIATMLLNKSNSRSSNTPANTASRKQRSMSMPEIPESPYITRIDRSTTGSEYLLNKVPYPSKPLKPRTRTLSTASSLKNLSSLVSSRKDFLSDVLKNQKPKPGEPILVSARQKSSRSSSFSCPYYLLDANTKQLMLTGESSLDAAQEKPRCSCLKDRADWSLFILPPNNRLRKFLQAISASKWFDYFILLMILFSCVLLAMENPNIKQDSTEREVIQTSMFVLTWLFTAEMLIKVLAHGLLFGPEPYLRKGWNCLDGFLVLLSWIDFVIFLSAENSQADVFKAFRVLRALRSLRPLRMIRRAPGLKLVVQTLLYSLKPIGNTVLIAAIFFVVFGILGVQLMKGTFYHCLGAPYVVNRSQCEGSPGEWVNHQYNFDNLPKALISLFVVSTKDGWVEIMRQGTDAVDVDQQPRNNHAMWRIIYFVSFLLIGGFLVLNMIVGVVVENFQRCRELQGDKDNAKKALAKWRECARNKSAHDSFLKSYSKPRLLLYKLCTNSYWDIGITILILLNVICMAIEHYDMSQTLLEFIEISNIVFTVFYAVEALLQIVALGFKQYFRNKWYLFDFIVVVISVLGIALEKVFVEDFKINPGVVRGLRMLRVVRVLKLLKVAKGLQFLLDHIKETIPQVTNLALLFSLLFFIYSCLGIQIFGTIECSAQTPCTGLGKHANFKDLGSSMLTLFRIATGDNWSGILKDTLRPGCDDSPRCSKNCCLSKYAAPAYFVTFVLFAQFVLVNIVIAVLMKHLRVTKLCKDNLTSTRNSVRKLTASRPSDASESGKAAVGKWQKVVAARKMQRKESFDTASYSAAKQSADDAENIQLKTFENHSEASDNNTGYKESNVTVVDIENQNINMAKKRKNLGRPEFDKERREICKESQDLLEKQSMGERHDGREYDNMNKHDCLTDFNDNSDETAPNINRSSQDNLEGICDCQSKNQKSILWRRSPSFHNNIAIENFKDLEHFENDSRNITNCDELIDDADVNNSLAVDSIEDRNNRDNIQDTSLDEGMQESETNSRQPDSNVGEIQDDISDSKRMQDEGNTNRIQETYPTKQVIQEQETHPSNKIIKDACIEKILECDDCVIDTDELYKELQHTDETDDISDSPQRETCFIDLDCDGDEDAMLEKDCFSPSIDGLDCSDFKGHEQSCSPIAKSGKNAICENPGFFLEGDDRSLHSPAFCFADDFFAFSDNESLAESLLGSPENKPSLSAPINTKQTPEPNNADQLDTLKKPQSKTSSIVSCGSFELLPVSPDLLKKAGPDRTTNKEGSNESFDILLPDGEHVMTVTYV